MTPRRLPAVLGVLAFLLSGCSVGREIRREVTQPSFVDPYGARVRMLTKVPYPAFQGDDCITIAARRAIVWKLLAAPEHMDEILLADLPNVVPSGAHYQKVWTAQKDAVLVLDAITLGGPRNAELTVLAAVPGELLAFRLTKASEELTDVGMAQLTWTFLVEERPDGTTDVAWASHYDADSPFAAAVLSMSSKKKQQSRRQAGLLTLRSLAEAAASMKNPPLHEMPTAPDPLRRRPARSAPGAEDR
jgi:uncharacterized protein YndB with AHSA1/START domain